ncbi:MAG TPA: cytochrome c3 family protein [Polyangia bacterium]|nr:cytochrome c3 family protein [Polyangia bacterium]
MSLLSHPSPPAKRGGGRGEGAAIFLVLTLALLSACHHAPPTCPGGPLFTLDAPAAPVGFDASFTIAATPVCSAANAGTITWTQLSGPRARDVSPTADGLSLHARTPSLPDALGAPAPWGVVPFSPRTRAELVFEATWRDGRGHEERHEARVAAAPRSRGLASTAVGTRIFLGPFGAAWRLESRPPNATATLVEQSGLASLAPDVTGDWRVVDGAGRALTLRTARYDETPLDCARSGCHPAESRAVAASPMTTVLARGIVPAAQTAGAPATFGAAYPDCALACHATGEPGCADGGFTDVMTSLGLASLGARAWADVPRPLRRLGGVGCLACHGPGALPETSARWAILRTDVCATCHDAPPRYGHVAAWRSTSMARADRDPRTRAGTCARCHTTAGVLASNAHRLSPPQIEPMGLTCVACHMPHDPGSGMAVAARSAVCFGCHSPGAGEPVTASAAPLWLGRGGVEPATGAPLTGAAPHSRVEGGCVGCHRAGPSDLQRGAEHAFVARRDDCGRCHAPKPDDDVRARALALWARTQPRDVGAGPPHASSSRFDLATPRGRAAWDLALVVEDPAADAHNAPYARQLLAAAEKVFNPGGAP